MNIDMTQLSSLVDLGDKKLYLGGPKGFNIIEEAFSCVDRLGIKEKVVVVVKYKEQYYPVLMQNF